MNSGEPVNDVEICVVACKRSGHHAVMNWLAEQFPGTPFFLNNCRVGESPFTETRKSLERAGRDRDAEPYRREEDGRLSRKELLLYNFEDCDLRQVFSPAEKARRASALGPSRTRYNILVVRDHYNLFASRIKRVRLGSDVPRENLKKALVARNLYVQHARECLDETRYIDEHRVVILFNRWFRDQDYRRDISAQLHGTYREDTLDHVAVHGEGSSFKDVHLLRTQLLLQRCRLRKGDAALHVPALSRDRLPHAFVSLPRGGPDRPRRVSRPGPGGPGPAPSRRFSLMRGRRQGTAPAENPRPEEILNQTCS